MNYVDPLLMVNSKKICPICHGEKPAKKTCQNCHQKGGYLESHHIKRLSEYPKLAYEVDNGITYCLKCHIKKDEKRKRFTKKI